MIDIFDKLNAAYGDQTLADSDQIKDKKFGKKQDVLNKEILDPDDPNSLKSKVDSFNGIVIDPDNVVSTDKSDIEVGSSKIPTGNAVAGALSDAVLKAGVFDISAYNLTNDQPTPYADLEAALGNNGENVPEAVRKGGMQVKFIQGSVGSSDNKYVQYRLMSNSFNVTPANWQGVDDTPTAGSDNIVKSGGVEATLFHHYGTKELIITENPQKILLREFNYGSNIAVRVVSNTADLGSNKIMASCRQTVGSPIEKSIDSEWTIFEADNGAAFNRIYIYINGTIESEGIVVVEAIFKDAFDAIIKDSVPDIYSERAVKSRGIYPFAESAFKHRPSKNLCNPKDPGFILGKLLSNGIEYNYNNYGITGFIPVSQNGLIATNITNSYGFTVYDSDYRYIRSVTNTNGIYTYVEGDAYVRCTFAIGKKDIIQVEEGTTATTYEEYNPVQGYVEQSNLSLNYVKAPVHPSELSFLHSYNLFDKTNSVNYYDGISDSLDKNVLGAYMASSSMYGNNDYFVTAYMPVGQAEYYASTVNGPTKRIRWISYYDENKTYLSTETISDSTQRIFRPITNAKYARLTAYMSGIDSFMVTFDLDPQEFVPYGKYFVDDIFIETEREELNPEIIIPSIIYSLDGEQNSIYHNEYIDCYNPYAYYLQKLAGSSWNYLESCWRRDSDASAGSTLKFALKNRLTKKTVQEVNVTMQTAAGNAGSNAIKVSCIGDSFCYAGYYLKQITDVCDNLTMVGMRLSTNTNIPCEGRGGWKLSNYMNPKSADITLSHIQAFSPFMHANGYNYYGVMEFWASIVNNTSQYSYGTDGFSAYSSWFDSNGRKANPLENDLVYNQTAGKFEYYNGSTWVQLVSEPEFEFNYAKYLQIWQIDCPDFVVIQLGTNDFYDNDTGFDAWKTNMDSVIDSINACGTAHNKTINIIMCTVLTISGLSYNTYGDGYIEKSRKYWEIRKKTITAFDTETYRTTKHVFIVDTGTSVDDKYGFGIQEKKPFEYYTGDARISYNYNGVHPSEAGYKQFGTCIAAAIQCLRT